MKKILIPLLFCALLFSGCGAEAVQGTGGSAETGGSDKDESASSEIFAMDTIITMTAYGEQAAEAIAAAEEEIYRLDELLSTGGASSEITHINENGGGKLSEDTAALVSEALRLYAETDGAFDITVYPLMRLWGFPDQNYRVPSQDELNELLRITGSDKLEFDDDSSYLSFIQPGMAIDLGGIAKGYASERLMDIFRDYGVESALVSLGGNVQTLGTKPDGADWRVGVQDPVLLSSNIGTLHISDRAAVTSGGYQRYFEEDGETYHHILDPESGTPANSGLISVTIVSGDGSLADALSTALFVMGTDDAISYWRENSDIFDAVLVTDSGRILVTAGLEDCFSSDYEIELVSL